MLGKSKNEKDEKEDEYSVGYFLEQVREKCLTPNKNFFIGRRTIDCCFLKYTQLRILAKSWNFHIKTWGNIPILGNTAFKWNYFHSILQLDLFSWLNLGLRKSVLIVNTSSSLFHWYLRTEAFSTCKLRLRITIEIQNVRSRGRLHFIFYEFMYS